MSEGSFSRRFRVHSRLTLTVLLLTTVSLSLCGGVIYVLARQSLKGAVDQELENTTTTVVNMVHAAVDVSVRNYLRAIVEKNLELVDSYYREYQEGLISEEEARTLAERLLLNQTIGSTGYIYCLDSQGQVVVHPKEGMRGTNVLENEFVREQVKLRTGYTEYDWANPGEWKRRPKAQFMAYFEPWDWIIFASSYREEFNSLVNAEDFRDKISAINLGESGYIFILGVDGTVVMHPWAIGNIREYRNIFGKTFVDDILRFERGKATYRWQEPGDEGAREKVAVFERLPEMGWIVAASMYVDEVSKPVRQIVYIVLIATVLTGIVAVPFIVAVGRSVVRPVGDLVGLFNRAAAGDLKVRSDDCSPDEIGKLARRFNAFMAQLEGTNRNLLAQMERREQADIAREALLAELESSNVEMERFLYTVSHDMRSPLITVMGFLGLLIRDFEQGNAEGVRHAAGRIESAAKHMQGLLDELLQLSSVGRLDNPWETFSLDRLLTEVLELLDGSIQAGGVEVAVGELGEVRGDRKRILEVFQNLIENSIKYGPQDGPALIVVGRREENGRPLFFVSDNGRGVDPRYLEKIFGLFEQLDKDVVGMGMGLALIKRIVEVHGGTIRAESDGPGAGTTFLFTLPQAELDEDETDS